MQKAKNGNKVYPANIMAKGFSFGEGLLPFFAGGARCSIVRLGKAGGAGLPRKRMKNGGQNVLPAADV